MRVSQSNVAFVRELVHGKAAIVIDESKSYLIESRLGALARAKRVSSVDTLIARAREGSIDLQTEVIEAITTNETTFFRDLVPFEALRLQVLPRLLEARARSRRLTIWSAACSTGQEPYSVAMLLREHFPQLAGWQVRIVATDLSRPTLKRARAGHYRQLEINRGLPASLLVKHFVRHGSEWVVSAELRSMVDFALLNLIDPWPADLRPDLVLMRNVLIYFDVATKRSILERLRGVMPGDGALFLGSAETTIGLDDAWQRVPFASSAYYCPRS